MKIIPYIPTYDGEDIAKDQLTIYNFDVQTKQDDPDYAKLIKTDEIHKSTSDTPSFESFLHILGNKYKKPVSKSQNYNHNNKSEKESREEESISLKISPTQFPDFSHNSADKIITGSDKNINQNQMAPHKNHHDKHSSLTDSSLTNLEVPELQKTDRIAYDSATKKYHWYFEPKNKVPVINQIPYNNPTFNEPEDLYFIKAVLIFCTSFLIFFLCSQLFLCAISLLSRINRFIRKCFFGEDGGDNKSDRERLTSAV